MRMDRINALSLELLTGFLASQRGQTTDAEDVELIARVVNDLRTTSDLVTMLCNISQFTTDLIQSLAETHGRDPQELLQEFATITAAQDTRRR